MSQRKRIQYAPDYQEPDSILQDILKLLSKYIDNKKIQLSEDTPKDIMSYCDPTLVMIIFRNLITHAIKFSNAGGAVIIIIHKMEDEVSFCIEDKGIEVYPEQVKRLIRNKGIESTRGTSEEKGTGL